MKTVKLVLLIVGIFAIFFSKTPEIWAGGGPGEDDPKCLVANPGSGARALRGTSAMVYTPGSDTNPPNIDVTLRLERRGVQQFFRLNLVGVPLEGQDDLHKLSLITCPEEYLDPDDPAIDKVANFVEEILVAFFGPSGADMSLVITEKAISDTDPVLDELESERFLPVPDTVPQRLMSIADITIYAVENSSP
jgi:hypothetical protein